MAKRLKLLITILFIVSVLLVSTLTVFSDTNEEKKSPVINIKGAIVPHHLLVENYIDNFYKELSQNTVNIERIILLSPNHFNYGFHYIQSTDKEFTPEDSPFLDINIIKELAKNTPLKTESSFFEKEHGIMVELPFIKKYFPSAKVAPIIIKGNTPKNRLDSLILGILKTDLSKTLMIASIDFTHYESEKIALINDNRIINWLKLWSSKNLKNTFESIKKLAKSSISTTYSSVAIDSPESLYVLTYIMAKEKAKNFTLWKRSSSASLTNSNNPLQNTSHIFAYFSTPASNSVIQQ